MPDPSESHENPSRRGFLSGLAAISAGALALLVPIASAITVVFDPLRGRLRQSELLRVTTLSVLPVGGRPRRFEVRRDQVDAWTTHPNLPVGSVYLRRVGENGVEALNVVCPHAGCSIGMPEDASGFQCPCHSSKFALDGSIADPSSPSPRPMDRLEAVVRPNGEVWVRFLDFQPGRPDQVRRA
jgi:menaquinol-cytochrome c reductase iron-sulfur subunit